MTTTQQPVDTDIDLALDEPGDITITQTIPWSAVTTTAVIAIYISGLLAVIAELAGNSTSADAFAITGIILAGLAILAMRMERKAS